MAKKKITTKAAPAAGKRAGGAADPAGGGGGGRAAAAAAAASSPMDVGLLAELVKLMSANDLNTVELRDGGKRVILRRGPAVVAGAAPAYAAAPADDADLVPVKSEMVGTFYASPKPGTKAFVAVGTPVVKDETDVCILEAMKTFNTMKSSVTGTVAKVLVQDGQSVQFDQPLFLVKP